MIECQIDPAVRREDFCAVDEAFAEGHADLFELRLGEAVAELGPELLDGHFDLGDGQHGVLDGVTLLVGQVDVEVVDVADEVPLADQPVAVVDGVLVGDDVGVFERLEGHPLVENAHVFLSGRVVKQGRQIFRPWW